MKAGIFELINNLKKKTFVKKFRGYDSLEVDGYMRSVANQINNSFSDYQDLKKKLQGFEVELLEFKEREDLLKNTLSNATKMSEKITKDSDRQARLIISDAEHRADMITREAKDSLRKIYQDISELRRIRLQFENNLKAILNSHLTMIEQGQRTIPDPIMDETKIKMDMKSLEPKMLNMSDEDTNHHSPDLDI